MTASGFYHCSVKSVGRAKGRSVVAAAAYRAGVVMMDERTGQIADYRARDGVLDSFIIAPDNAPAWVQARTWLWNRAEAAEHRVNGRLATELELALPHELDAAARKRLLKDFLAPIIERYGVAADVAIHEPGEGRDHRNIHAHVLITNRRLDENGFVEKVEGQRKDIGMSGFGRSSEAVIEIRKEWEQHVNLAYERAGLDIKVDHRSHEDRGIEQEPTKHLGPTATAMERRGEPSDRGDINREIGERNQALRDRAQLEIEAVKVEAELAAAKMLAEMERRDQRAVETIQQDYAAAAGRRDDIRSELGAAARAAEMEQRKAATGRADDIRPDRSTDIDRQAAQAMQEAHRAAAGRTDDIHPAPTVQPDYAAAKGRVDDIRPLFEAAAARTTEPAAPIYDRDAAGRMADERIIDSAIAAAQEARQTPEAAPQAEKHGRGAEPAQTPPPSTQEHGSVPDSGLCDADNIGSRIFGGLASAAEKFVDWLGDVLFPAPPPTRDQAERMERVAEERQQAHAEQAAQQERTEAQHWLVEEARRQAAREREEEERAKTAAERYGTPRAQEWDNDRDRDRGYERER
jgi:MobA/MobL family